MRMWQWSTYWPVKSTKRVRILNQPGMYSVQVPFEHFVYGRSGAGQLPIDAVVSVGDVGFVGLHLAEMLICCPEGIANTSHHTNGACGCDALHGLKVVGSFGFT